jgi:hypothetical protein
MSVKPENLENPERDMKLLTREGGPAQARKRDDLEAAAEQLRTLRERIAEAAKATPRDTTPHCGDCFRRGWAAALRAVEGT